METYAERVGDAPVAHSQTGAAAQTRGRDYRSADEFNGEQHGSTALNADAGNRFSEDAADHWLFYGADGGAKQGNRGDGCGYLFTDRHVDFHAGRGAERREESVHSRAEVTWNGEFKSGT